MCACSACADTCHPAKTTVQSSIPSPFHLGPASVTSNVLITVTTAFSSYKAVSLRLASRRREKRQAAAAACVKIQSVLRGTLARWNLPVLQLTRRLEHIHILKDKQLKKLAQRQVQAKLDIRVEMESTHPHRVLMRRIQKAEFLQSNFQAKLDKEVKACQELQNKCQTTRAENNGLQVQIMTVVEDSKSVRREIIHLGFKTRELQGRCQEYQQVIDIWKAAVAQTDTHL